MQPTPTVTIEDVERIVNRDFDPHQCADAFSLLKNAHFQDPRIEMAILKLASGNISLLSHNIETARNDYRDVLAAAEYPDYSKTIFHIDDLSEEEQARTIKADWKQYQDWLTR
jgi:hypothetical protein